LDEKIAEKGKLEELEPPKDVIKSELLFHQKEGLGWLVYRENSSELPPFWEEKDGEYINVLTNYMTPQRPEPLRGGIFADDMGLGKTLTLLSLIAFDKFCGDSPSADAGNVDVERDELADDKKGKKLKRERGTQNCKKPQKRVKNEEDGNVAEGKGKSICTVDRPDSIVSRATLIVCPPSVLSAWLTQLEDHTVRGRLKTYLYHGERTEDPYELKEYDIVLTTYSTLSMEDSYQESPVKKIEWRRVILDEAHVIKNVNALQSRAVTKLNAKRRWVVTGTPIQNHSFDLFSLMAFLRFEPLSIKNYWTSLIARPLSLGDEKGISRLQVISLFSISFTLKTQIFSLCS
jgi:SWI/SNF-related matrix-associated actin-dependent regulator of chromatin subfamily A3